MTLMGEAHICFLKVMTLMGETHIRTTPQHTPHHTHTNTHTHTTNTRTTHALHTVATVATVYGGFRLARRRRERAAGEIATGTPRENPQKVMTSMRETHMRPEKVMASIHETHIRTTQNSQSLGRK